MKTLIIKHNNSNNNLQWDKFHLTRFHNPNNSIINNNIFKVIKWVKDKHITINYPNHKLQFNKINNSSSILNNFKDKCNNHFQFKTFPNNYLNNIQINNITRPIKIKNTKITNIHRTTH